MNATDRLALAAYGEHLVKRARSKQAWLNSFAEAHPIADIGMSMLPGVGSIYSGSKAIGNFARGEIGSGIGNLAMAGLSFLPGMGLAGAGAKGVARFLPKTIGRLGAARNVAATKMLGKSGLGNAILSNSDKVKSGLGGVLIAGQAPSIFGRGAQATQTASSTMPLDEMLNMARSHTMSNPMYASPGFSGAPNPYGF